MRVDAARVAALLRDGDIETLGLLPDASNYTFAVKVADGDLVAIAVYKPRDGEQPLWDFPDGTLYRREVATFLVSEALGWSLVPPTVVRDGPHGVGSVQLYIEHDPDDHYLTLMPARADDFRRVALLDVIVNNADRKSSHCLLERETDRVWVVDHGVCFHAEPKLRTVIWDFAGESLPDGAVRDIERLRGELGMLDGLLAADELEATAARIDELLASGVFPSIPQDRRAVPWPPV